MNLMRNTCRLLQNKIASLLGLSSRQQRASGDATLNELVPLLYKVVRKWAFNVVIVYKVIPRALGQGLTAHVRARKRSCGLIRGIFVRNLEDQTPHQRGYFDHAQADHSS